MKSKFLLLGLLLTGIILVYSLNLSQAIIGPHGGRLKQVENFNIEMQPAFPNHCFYLFDQKLQPINNNGISCELRFFFPDNTSVELTLKPFQDDGFIIETNKIVFDFCIVTFNVFGKSVSAKFERENIIAQKK